MEVKPPPLITELVDAHKGEAIFVVCCGPSRNDLSSEERELLNGMTTLSMNVPPEWLTPTYHMKHDRLIWANNSEVGRNEELARLCVEWRVNGTTKTVFKSGDDENDAYPSIRLRIPSYVPDYVYLWRGFDNGFEPPYLPLSGSSTSAALWLALLMGARRVYCLGLDMHFEDPKLGVLAHDEHHKSFGKECAGFHIKPDAVSKQFEMIQGKAVKLGSLIINCNMESACEAFPKLKASDVVRLVHADMLIESGAV